MGMVNGNTIGEVFKHHPPTPDKIANHQAIREAGKVFAQVILDNSPTCADQSTALRDVRNAVLHANEAIALDGLI